MSRSNRALQPREIQEATLRMYLCNTGFVDASDGREVAWESFNVEAHASGMARVYRDWREWVAAEYPGHHQAAEQEGGHFLLLRVAIVPFPCQPGRRHHSREGVVHNTRNYQSALRCAPGLADAHGLDEPGDWTAPTRRRPANMDCG